MTATQSPFEGISLGAVRRFSSGAALLWLCFGCCHAEPPPAEPAPMAPVATDDTIAAPAAAAAAPEDLRPAAAGFHELFLHDDCTGPFPPQPDTCAHNRVHEKTFTFGGNAGTVYDVTLHVRGIFEPTTIEGGETPDPAHPYFKAGGRVGTLDWSYWHIEVSEPKQTYFLNHYPSVSHIIHKEDFEATIAVAGGAKVVVRAIDGNDRQIDNAKPGPDRQQLIEGVSTTPLAGQMLRLDVVRVTAR